MGHRGVADDAVQIGSPVRILHVGAISLRDGHRQGLVVMRAVLIGELDRLVVIEAFHHMVDTLFVEFLPEG